MVNDLPALALKQERIRELIRQMAQVETELTELTGGIDAVMVDNLPTPILLRQAQAELQQRTAELSRANQALGYQAYLLDNMADIVIAVDADRRVTAWNRAAEEIIGISEQAALGHLVDDLVTVEMVGSSQEAALDALLQTGRYEGEVWLESKHGGPRVITALKAVALCDERDNLRGVLNVHRDIRVQKQAEEERIAHERRLEILHQIDRSILASRSPEVIAAETARRLRAAIGCDRVSVMLINPGAGTMTVLAQEGAGAALLTAGAVLPFDFAPTTRDMLLNGQTCRIADLAVSGHLGTAQQYARASGLHCWVGVPMMADGALLGGVNLAWVCPDAATDADITLTTQVAHSLTVALQNARLFGNLQASREQLQALSRRLVEVQEAERRVISRELHDETGQAITSLKMGLGMLLREADLSEASRAHINELRQTVDGIMDGLHRLAVNLRPLSLDRYGLVPAVEQFLASFRKQTGLYVELATEGIGKDRLPGEVETVLYRAVQEGLANIARHSQATRASVILRGQPDSITLIVEDNGRGFEVGQELEPGHLGLLGMRERTQIIGGTLTIESRPGRGTTLFVEVPRNGEVHTPDDRSAAAGL